MKRGGGVHTVPASEGTGWRTTVNGDVVSKHRLKRVAVAKGRSIARKLRVEHTIHRADGVITEKNSYGNDPYPPKDGG